MTKPTLVYLWAGVAALIVGLAALALHSRAIGLIALATAAVMLIFARSSLRKEKKR